MTKKFVRTFSLCLAAAVVLFMSLYLISKSLNLHILGSKKPSSISAVTKKQTDTNDDNIDRSTRIIFKTLYKKSNETQDKDVTAGDLNILSKKELAEQYESQGYTVESISKKEIVLLKELDQYAPNKNEPNKWILGISNGFIAIYHTDSRGDMHIDDRAADVTSIRVSNLKDEDKRLLTEGEFIFNSKEDAEAKLEDYI